MQTSPALNGAIKASADQTATTSPVALSALFCGANGICVTAHPSNDPGSVIRVASNADATHGQPLGPGGSWTFAVSNAAALKCCLEASATTAILTVTQA